MDHFDVIVIGAGAAGLMCAAEAGRRGRSVLVIDHADKAGKKILISGGGKCNFTNLYAGPADFLCSNPHFVKSALSRFTQYDFLDLVSRYGIAWEEREHGQLFCIESAKQIVDMLLAECRDTGVEIQLNCTIESVAKRKRFELVTNRGTFSAEALVVATGSRSIPKMGATGFGHQIARQFGLNVTELRAGLVPFRFTGREAEALKALAGISLPVTARCGGANGNGATFSEAMLFTHRGLSGPAMLQISSYWRQGDTISIDLLPGFDVAAQLKSWRETRPKAQLHTLLAEQMPKRFAVYLCETVLADKPAGQLSDRDIETIAATLHGWQLRPAGTEGYRTAEVTVGGVDSDELSSKTMESKKVSGLYFIGEVVDVSGHLGGFNFQWAWSSGYAAAIAIADLN